MPWAFGGGYDVSIPHQRRGNWPLFRQLSTLCVYRPNRHGTYELWPPGPGLVSQMPRAFGGGHGVSIPHERRVSLLLFVNFWPREEYDGAASAANVPSTYAG